MILFYSLRVRIIHEVLKLSRGLHPSTSPLLAKTKTLFECQCLKLLFLPFLAECRNPAPLHKPLTMPDQTFQKERLAQWCLHAPRTHLNLLPSSPRATPSHHHLFILWLKGRTCLRSFGHLAVWQWAKEAAGKRPDISKNHHRSPTLQPPHLPGLVLHTSSLAFSSKEDFCCALC